MMVGNEFRPSAKLKKATSRFKRSLDKDIGEAKKLKTLKAKKEAAERITKRISRFERTRPRR